MLPSSSKYTMQYDLKITFIQRTLFWQKEPYSADSTLETSVRVRLSTSVNVSSNNSPRAETFALIMFEYVTFCFIRFYLLMPLPKTIAHYNLQGGKKHPHLLQNTHSRLHLGLITKAKFPLYFFFSLKVKQFFSHQPGPATVHAHHSRSLQSSHGGGSANHSTGRMRADVSCA